VFGVFKRGVGIQFFCTDVRPISYVRLCYKFIFFSPLQNTYVLKLPRHKKMSALPVDSRIFAIILDLPCIKKWQKVFATIKSEEITCVTGVIINCIFVTCSRIEKKNI